MARYLNKGSSPLSLSIGTRPGCSPIVYEADPGGVVDGPEAYEKKFVNAGFTRVEDDYKEVKPSPPPKQKPKRGRPRKKKSEG